MIIHILDTDKSPALGCEIIANCGERITFDPIDAEWGDGRICKDCKRIHVDSNNRSLNTFAVPKS